MRVVFFGSDAIGLPALAWLRTAAGVELAGVVSQPDRPVGRGRQLQPNPVAAWAKAQGVELRQPEKPGAAEAAWLKEKPIDLALVMAYGHILRKELLDAVPRGMWNLHGSRLPAYRGPSPIEAAVAGGDQETAVCLMRMALAMDAGPVADSQAVPIGLEDTAPQVRARMGELCVPLLERNWAALVDGSIQARPQDEAQATYTRKLTKADAQLDFAAPAEQLARRVRAMAGWPGTMVEHAGVILKVGKVAVLSENGGSKTAPSAIVQAGAEGVDVATGAGVLRLRELQRPGGKMLAAAEFLRGYRLEPGQILASHAMTPLVSLTPFPRPPKAPVAG